MQSGYATKRLQEAAAAVATPQGDIRDALYAAYLQLHTLLPEQLPDGEPRRRMVSIHDRLTHRHPGDAEETSVIDVIRRMDDESAAALAKDIGTLWKQVAALADGPRGPGEGRPRRAAPPAGAPWELHPLHHPRVPPGGRVLIVFGSTEGHTHRLAEFAAARLTSAGYELVVHDASLTREDPRVDGFAAVFVAASIHWGRYQSSVIGFAKVHHEALNARPTAFISVSLLAAGVVQPEPGTLDDYVDALRQETLWEPEAVHHVAGRIRHSGYDYFKRLAAALIATQRGDAVDPTRDYDLTDYGALEEFVTAFAAGTAMERGGRSQAGADLSPLRV